MDVSRLNKDYAGPTFVIEHSEEDGILEEWSQLEYRNASRYVGGPKHIWYTHVQPEHASKVKDFGRTEAKSLAELVPNHARVCVADPEAKEVLCPADRELFDFIVIGGILGDQEFTGRTKKEVTSQRTYMSCGCRSFDLSVL